MAGGMSGTLFTAAVHPSTLFASSHLALSAVAGADFLYLFYHYSGITAATLEMLLLLYAILSTLLIAIAIPAMDTMGVLGGLLCGSLMSGFLIRRLPAHRTGGDWRISIISLISYVIMMVVLLFVVLLN